MIFFLKEKNFGRVYAAIMVTSWRNFLSFGIDLQFPIKPFYDFEFSVKMFGVGVYLVVCRKL